MNGIWAVPNKSWKRNETKAEWKRIGANHRLLTWFRGGNQYRASQNIDVTDPEDPRAQKDQEDQKQTIVSRQFIWGEKATMRQIIYVAQYLFHVILMSYDHLTNVLGRFIQLPSKISFFFFYLLCKPADLIFLRYLNIYIFQNIPIQLVCKNQIQFSLKILTQKTVS